MTILEARFSASSALGWRMIDAGGVVVKEDAIEPSASDPLVELRHLELRSGVARVHFHLTPEHTLTPSERDYAYACGWKLL